MISFHSLYVTPKQDYLHSIHFHSFLFLYFKTSDQSYLISFFSIHFPYLNTFNYIPLWSFYSIAFHFFMNSQTKPKNKNHALEWNNVFRIFLILLLVHYINRIVTFGNGTTWKILDLAIVSLDFLILFQVVYWWYIT